MINLSLPERSGWIRVFLLLFILLPFDGHGQDRPCTGRLQERIARASSLISAGQYLFAEHLLDQLLRETGRDCPQDSAALADIAYLSGNLALLNDDPKSALARYWEARARATGMLQLSRIDQNTGAAWFMHGDYERAVRYFSHAVSEAGYTGEIDPSRLISLYDNLGAACFENGETENAGKWWRKAEELAHSGIFPDSLLLARLTHNSGLVAFGEGDWPAATLSFRNALQLNPGRDLPADRMNVMIRKNLAVSLMKEGRCVDAWNTLEIFNTVDPVLCIREPVFCAEILRVKAWIRFTAGHCDEALSLLSEARELVRTDTDVNSGKAFQIVRFRLQRDNANMRFLMVPDIAGTGTDIKKEIYAAQQEAFALLTPFMSVDGSYQELLLQYDSLQTLLYRTVNTGVTMISGRPEIATDLLGYTEVLFRRHRPEGILSPDVEGDTVSGVLADGWMRLNRQLYLCNKKEFGSPYLSAIHDLELQNRKFRIETELDSIRQLISKDIPDNDLRDIPGLVSDLADGEAVLNYLLMPGQVCIFIIRNDGIRIAVPETGAGLRDDLKELLTALGTADDAAFREIIPKISRALITPVLPALEGIRRLYVVSGRGLESLPFECLVLEENNFLVSRFIVTYHFSLSEITPDGKRKPGTDIAKTNKTVEFLAFSPAFTADQGLAEIGNAGEEANEIGRMFNRGGHISRVFAGEEANETTFLREARNAGIVHLATHAKVDRQMPEQSGLHFWKQPVSLTGDELIDGILEMGEVKGLRFNCSLLTLSSCSLGQGYRQSGRTGRYLQAAFLDAGARSMLYSLWNVSDRHTRTLMVDFYRFYLEGSDFPEALRKAKVKMMNNPATASPYFWSAFILTSK